MFVRTSDDLYYESSEVRRGHDFIQGTTPEEREITVILITLPLGNYVMVTKMEE